MKDIAAILMAKAETKVHDSLDGKPCICWYCNGPEDGALQAEELTHTPAELPDIYLVDGKHLRNLARVLNAAIRSFKAAGALDESDLGAFFEITQDILEATGVDRSGFGDLEVLE